MKIFIRKVDGEFPDDWLYAAYVGFKQRGADITTFENISDVPPGMDNLVVSFIEETETHMINSGVTIPTPLNVPEVLEGYAAPRKILTMAEFKKETELPIFIKPNAKLKQFPCGVISKESSRQSFFTDVPDETEVMITDVLDIKSEWRGFVHNNKLVGLKHYGDGGFTEFPNDSIIRGAIGLFGAYKNGDEIETYNRTDTSKKRKIITTKAPIAYSIDFAVTSSGATKLIECNDFWSIGNYGLDPTLYTTMLIDRWREIA